MYKGSFHFVNKNGSNLTHREAEEAFRISSHVAKRYYQWSKQAKGKPYKSGICHQSAAHSIRKTRKARADTPSEIFSPLLTAGRDDDRDPPSEDTAGKTICWQLGRRANTPACPSINPPDLLKLSGQPPTVEEIDEQYLVPELWHEKPTPKQMLALPKSFDFNAPDWAACPIFQKQALQIFRSWFLSFGYTNIQQANHRQSIDAAWRKQVSELVADRKSLHGWYASVLTIKALYMQPEYYTFLYPMALRHQNRSLMLLRSHLRENPDPSKSLLLCIWCIGVTAIHSGDVQLNLAHAPAMWAAVDRLGGFDALDMDTRAHVLLLNNINSRFTMTRPHLHHSIMDPGPFQDQPGFARYGTLTSDMALQFNKWDEAFLLPEDALSDDLQKYIMAHREFMVAHALAGNLLSEQEHNNADSIFYWLRLRRAALGSWTMTLYCDIIDTITPQTRLSRLVRRQLQACLCLAVSYAMSFTYGFTLPLEKWLIYIPIQNLRPQIEILLEHMRRRGTLPTGSSLKPTTSALKPSFAITHHETLLFLFFVGACAEQVSDDAGKRPELLVDKSWHSTRFCEMIKILGLRTWKETRKVLQRFVYGDGVVMDRFVEGLFEMRHEFTGQSFVLGAE
ncbi:hypothetical protein H2200_005803 [Cladophialophora chaetospira]|uniref:Uncharacterized protein n=1 Tax=Cladophialophora chaetospira TaxID=386627 RepID=A0AA38X9V8_9EURO|nr:hypothetical protein H2200_005803 [Cladophialophora chaetospira]